MAGRMQCASGEHVSLVAPPANRNTRVAYFSPITASPGKCRKDIGREAFPSQTKHEFAEIAAIDPRIP